MSTLAEIEAAIPNLNAAELAELEKLVLRQLQGISASPRHSVLEIPVASIGALLKPFSPDDNLLGDMLEGKM